MADRLQIDIGQGERVTARVYDAMGTDRTNSMLVLGHGAGGNQASRFMVHFATGLAARGISVMTFNFPYAEHGRRTPDRTDRLEACYRAAILSTSVRSDLGSGRLFIGGKSLGGRIASHVAAAGSGIVCTITGLVFLGYPLHPPGRPELLRAKHLPLIEAPMLFVQGSRDPFGTPDELRPILASLGAPAKLYVVDDGDHSLTVSKRGPVSQEQIFETVQGEIASWIRAVS